MSIAALCNNQKLKQPKYVSTDKWINKLQYSIKQWNTFQEEKDILICITTRGSQMHYSKWKKISKAYMGFPWWQPSCQCRDTRSVSGREDSSCCRVSPCATAIVPVRPEPMSCNYKAWVLQLHKARTSSVCAPP